MITKVEINYGQNVGISEKIIGLPGPQGQQGVDGLQGPAGNDGLAGNDGIQGIQGDIGPQGLQGDAGAGMPVGGATGQVPIKATSADHDLAWSTSFIINPTTGYVGIGGTPNRPLHIQGTGQNFARIQGTGTVGMEFNSNGFTQQALTLDTANNLIFRNTTGTHGGSLYFDFKANAFFRAGSNGYASVMTLTTSKKVGINTTAPTTDLHVNGPIRSGVYTVLTAPSASASGQGSRIYVTDEVGGSVSADSDGAVWRRSTDRAIIS